MFLTIGSPAKPTRIIQRRKTMTPSGRRRIVGGLARSVNPSMRSPAACCNNGGLFMPILVSARALGAGALLVRPCLAAAKITVIALRPLLHRPTLSLMLRELSPKSPPLGAAFLRSHFGCFLGVGFRLKFGNEAFRHSTSTNTNMT